MTYLAKRLPAKLGKFGSKHRRAPGIREVFVFGNVEPVVALAEILEKGLNAAAVLLERCHPDVAHMIHCAVQIEAATPLNREINQPYIIP